MQNISDLPDYPALEKLAAALWKQNKGIRGAAVMVGAGFSRSAASTTDVNKKLPLWNDLALSLAEDLHANPYTDPLTLAEEYCAYFGKQALHDLIKKEINDVAWEPGKLYKSLLELPWSEILTTNWDTLLERASKDVHQPVYNIVARQEDLSSVSSPRIVKLHGTVNVTDELVFTQEEYRKYPQQYAAFVNFARQVFIENELCLIGFSGGDPNFLQWAGWVRDQMPMRARRVYIVGALDLTAAKRKYLESLNVSAIDLGNLVVDYDDMDAKHTEALIIFFQTLVHLKPKQAWDWSPASLHRSTLTTDEINTAAKNPRHDGDRLEQQLSTLELDRKSYPGWLVCPLALRWKLQSQINDPYPTSRNLFEMTPDSRAKLLYEIAWRHCITYEATPPWLAREMLGICNPIKSCAISKKQQLEVALLLLKNTRWFHDSESEAIKTNTTHIIESNSKYWPESVDELLFHQAIIARDEFDFSRFEKLAEKISDDEPVMKLKKASLLGELGRFDESKELINDAHQLLSEQYRNDRNSIYVLSRLAWSHWLLHYTNIGEFRKNFEEFPSSYYESKSNPWSHIEHIKERISTALEKQHNEREIEPLFEPGHYKDNSKSISFDSELHPILLLEGICCSTGMPLRSDNVNFLADPASKLISLDSLDYTDRVPLSIRAASSAEAGALKKTFSRMQMACVPLDETKKLFDRCISAIEYWKTKHSVGTPRQQRYALNRIGIFLEVLARISIRLSPEQAKWLFRFAMNLAKEPTFSDFWLCDPLKHLIQYTLASIPESQHHELLSDALLFPLASEVGANNYDKWPNPVVEVPGERVPNPIIDQRIDEVINRIAPCSSTSSSALLRLLPLLTNGYLNVAEQDKIAEKIWGNPPSYETLPDTGLYRYVLLKLPSKNSAAVRVLVRKYLFGDRDSKLPDISLLAEIENVARAGEFKELPSEKEAEEYFNQLITWRITSVDKDALRFLFNEESERARRIGGVLAHSVVPALPISALNEENFEKLYSFYTDVDAPNVVVAFTYFATANTLFANRVEKIIRLGLQNKNSQKIAYSSQAIAKWRERDQSLTVTKLISRLIYQIEASRVTGLSSLLSTVNYMLKSDYLSDEDIQSLTDVLPILFDNSDYSITAHNTQEVIDLSLVRSGCARLAKNILGKGQGNNSGLIRVLEAARTDALPEVRFAETSSS
jgi:hypothetical protein